MIPDYVYRPWTSDDLFSKTICIEDTISTLSSRVDTIDRNQRFISSDALDKVVQEAVERHFSTYYKPAESYTYQKPAEPKEFQINEEEFEENLHTLLFE